jgi:hypothetical protein
MGRKRKVKEEPMPTMKKPCCDRAWITYPYLNPTYCVNCGALRVDIPKHLEKLKKIRKKKRVVKENVDRYE